MRKEIKKAPTIRFRGFTDDWEQRKLGDICGVYDGVHQTPDYQEDGVMFLSVENIATLTSEKYISEDAYNRNYKAYPEKGDILMTRIGDVGTPHVVETNEKLAYYVSLALLKPKGIDSYFLNNAIQTSPFQKGLLERTLLTAIPMKINKDEIGKVDISFPVNISEQKQIGSYFRNLDNLITLHQRKLDQLKKLKKYFLQNMFPAKGEKVPRIRFKGFTGDWEQRKLGDICGVYDGVHQTPDYQEDGVMFLSVENIATLTSEKYISEDAYNRNYKAYPEKGDILMTRIGDVGTPHVVETNEKLAYYVSLALLKPKGIDSYFLNNAIQTSPFQKGLLERTLLTAIPMKINKDEIGKVDISFPVNISEQKQIGSYFRNLDNLITLHQRKLNQLQTMKKFMLQNLFI